MVYVCLSRDIAILLHGEIDGLIEVPYSNGTIFNVKAETLVGSGIQPSMKIDSTQNLIT